jgi:predicted PurR-regulated permease PerM
MNFAAKPLIKKLILLFLLIAGLYYGRIFLVPLAVAGLLASLFLPFCIWLESKKISRVIAALLCVFLLLLSISFVFAVIGWQVAELSNDIDMIKQRVTEAITNLKEFIYSHLRISIKKQEKMMESQNSELGRIVPLIAGSLASILTGFILMLVYIVLLLYYRTHLKEFLLMISPVHQRKEVSTLLNSATEVSHQYLLGLTKMIICLWIMYGIGFYLVGVKNPFFFAVLCGILEIVPFIGNITGTTITVLVSAAQGASISMLGGIIIIYAIVQFIQGWVLEPLIVGPQVKINAFVTIASLVIGNLIWGIPGIILAIPLTGMLKIVCDHIEPLKPYGFLIGDITKRKHSRFKMFLEKHFKRN